MISLNIITLIVNISNSSIIKATTIVALIAYKPSAFLTGP